MTLHPDSDPTFLSGAVWRDTLSSTTNLTADGNGNGMIDVGDYDIWKANFGNQSGLRAVAKSAVPEPSTLVTLVITAAVILLRRR